MNFLINFFTQIQRGKNFMIFAFLRLVGESFFYLIPLILAWFFSPEEFAKFSLVQMVVVILATVLLTSSQTPFIVNASKENVKNNKINHSFTIQLCFLVATFIIGSLAVVIFKKSFVSFTSLASQQYFFILFFFYGISLKTFFVNVFLSLDKRKISAYYALFVGMINLLVIFIFHQTIGLMLQYVFLSYFLSAVVSILFFLKTIDYKKLLPLYFSKRQLMETFKWTTWQIFGLLAVQLINWGDNIVLRYYVSLEKIGVYNVAYQLFKGLIGTCYLVNAYFLPFISQHIQNVNKITFYLKNKRFKILSLAGVFLILCWIFIPDLLRLIYGDFYVGAGSVFRILIVGVFFHLYTVFYLPIINALKYYKTIQFINIIHVILNLFLDIVLIKHFGIYGAAIATSSSYVITALLIKFYAVKRLNFIS